MDINLNIQNKKLELIRWLSTIDDLTIINKIIDIKKEKSDWWDEISEAEKKLIEEGEKDIEAGRVISHEDFLKSYGR
ncbi:hypothetical protein [Epilithonimonas sp.]|uniref:hypothetical protein n=1 Tax=Epilithonimonas sp. TaxID=2894511 RepID=UPI0028A243EF|nr:hypothetical protein [Epilithonimonas sp.]